MGFNIHTSRVLHTILLATWSNMLIPAWGDVKRRTMLQPSGTHAALTPPWYVGSYISTSGA